MGVGQLVDVYRNRNQHGYSIRDAKTKQVLGHAESVRLKDCKLVNTSDGAWVTGSIMEADDDVPQGFTRVISYNPHTLDFFTDLTSESLLKVTHLPEVVCSGKFLFAP